MLAFQFIRQISSSVVVQISGDLTTARKISASGGFSPAGGKKLSLKGWCRLGDHVTTIKSANLCKDTNTVKVDNFAQKINNKSINRSHCFKK